MTEYVKKEEIRKFMQMLEDDRKHFEGNHTITFLQDIYIYELKNILGENRNFKDVKIGRNNQNKEE